MTEAVEAGLEKFEMENAINTVQPIANDLQQQQLQSKSALHTTTMRTMRAKEKKSKKRKREEESIRDE